MPDEVVTVAREECAAGEVVLRRRPAGVLELVVDGAFAMDTVDTSTEVALARVALAEHPAPRRVLVGGLGLGFTARAVLADARVERLDVVEVAAPLVRWAREALVPELAGLEDDGRCRLRVADVADVLAAGEAAGEWDLVLLDVDNGPGFLIRPANRRLYRPDLLGQAYARLAPGGRLLIWSSHRSPELLRALAALGPGAYELPFTVERDARVLDYALYGLTHP